MSPVIINILAYLAILTLLAFFGVIAWAAMTVLHIVNEAKGAAKIINPPKQAAMQIVSVGKGIAQRAGQRGKVIAAHAKHAAASVTTVKDDVLKVYESIDVEGAKSAAANAAESVKGTGAIETLAFVKQVADIIRQVQTAQSSKA